MWGEHSFENDERIEYKSGNDWKYCQYKKEEILVFSYIYNIVLCKVLNNALCAHYI